MNYKYLLVILFLLALTCSCSNTAKEKKSIATDINGVKTLNLDYLYPFPKGMEYGGGGYYTYDSVNFHPSKYIFLSNLSGDSAVVKLNGEVYYLQYDSIHSIPRRNDSVVEAWKCGDLSVLLKLKVINETGNEMKSQGTFEVTKGKVSRKFKVHGGFED